MKKVLTIILLTAFSISNAQIRLAAHPLELKKSENYHQILNGVNTITKQVYVFASDKENVTLLRCNSALFFTDSLKVKRPDKPYETMAGYNFDSDGNPIIYWASEGFKQIAAIRYNLNTGLTESTPVKLDLDDQNILNTFSENNRFYILATPDKKQQLLLYVFDNGKPEQKILDFSPFRFENEKKKPITLSGILYNYTLEKIDLKLWTPLSFGTKKTKLYVLPDKMILTFDHNPIYTQLFTISLADFNITEKIIPHTPLEQDAGQGNSYFHNGRLYQFNANADGMALEVKDYKSGASIATYKASRNDSITFRNSPLYVQTGNHEARTLDNTKKFLRKLSNSDIGLTVYTIKNKDFVTIGGIRNIPDTGQLIVGLSVGVGVAMGGGGAYLGDLFDENLQNIYFESFLNAKGEHISVNQEPLATDLISQYLNEHNEAVLTSTFSYSDFYILGYYDEKAHEYVFIKFRDGK